MKNKVSENQIKKEIENFHSTLSVKIKIRLVSWLVLIQVLSLYKMSLWNKIIKLG